MANDSAAAFVRGDVREHERIDHEGPIVTGPQKNISEDDVDWMHVWGGKVGFQMLYRNEQAAISLVKQGIAERLKGDAESPFGLTLAKLGVPIRLCNTLEKEHSIRTVEEFYQADYAVLVATPQLGDKSVYLVMAILSKFAFGELDRKERESKVAMFGIE